MRIATRAGAPVTLVMPRRMLHGIEQGTERRARFAPRVVENSIEIARDPGRGRVRDRSPTRDGHLAVIKAPLDNEKRDTHASGSGVREPVRQHP